MIQLQQKYTVYEAILGDYTYEVTSDERGVSVRSGKTGNFHSAHCVGVLHPDGKYTPLLSTTIIPYFTTLGEARTAIEKFEASFC